MPRIAIIGLGYIGGSIGLGLKQAKLKNTEIVGYDDWGRARREGDKKDAVDRVYGSLREAVDGAGLVVLATPPLAAEQLLPEMAPSLGRGAAVTDVAASKSVVHRWASDYLPSGVSFVGGHPMAGGAARYGIDEAQADLFQGQNWFLNPAPNASDSAVKSVLGMVRELGAQPHFLSAEEHDFVVAGASHLPLLTSAALFTMLRRSEGWPDFGRAAADTFTEMTQFNQADPGLTTEIVTTNREQVKHWIDRLVVELHRYRELLDTDDDTIFTEFSTAQVNHAKFQAGADLNPDEAANQDIPDATSQMAALLVSPRIYDRVRSIAKRSEDREREARNRPNRR